LTGRWSSLEPAATLTEYRIEDGGLTVRDYVEADGEMRLFGEAHYTRVNGGI